jgi:hypothetical protein
VSERVICPVQAACDGAAIPTNAPHQDACAACRKALAARGAAPQRPPRTKLDVLLATARDMTAMTWPRLVPTIEYERRRIALSAAIDAMDPDRCQRNPRCSKPPRHRGACYLNRRPS